MAYDREINDLKSSLEKLSDTLKNVESGISGFGSIASGKIGQGVEQIGRASGVPGIEQIGALLKGLEQLGRAVTDFTDIVTDGGWRMRQEAFKQTHEKPVSEVSQLVSRYAEKGMSIPFEQQDEFFQVAQARQQRIMDAQRQVEERYARGGGVIGALEDLSGIDIERKRAQARHFIQDVWAEQGRSSFEERLAKSKHSAEMQRKILANQRVNQ